MLRFAKATAEEVVDILHTDVNNGLQSIAVESLQKSGGPNKLEDEEKVRDSFWASSPF